MTRRRNLDESTFEEAAEHPQEEGRLAELVSLGILDSLPEKRFDRITTLASDLFGVPIALVSLVDEDRQWFKSACGLDATETPRAVAFCSHAIVAKVDPFVVLDARQDPRFARNPLVTGDPRIRFYAGALVRGPSGFPLGTLCIVDDAPRQSFGPRNRSRLLTLASMVEDELARSVEATNLRKRAGEMPRIHPLTGLLNDRGCLDELAQLVRAGSDEKRKLAVARIRLDNLDAVRDELDEELGDRLLVRMSRRAAEIAGPDGVAACWRGRDLVVVRPMEARPDDWLHDLTMLFSRPLEIDGSLLTPAINVGAAIYPDDGTEPTALLEKAGLAVREANAVGEAFRLFDRGTPGQKSRRWEIHRRLKAALDRGELSLTYQPKVDLSSGHVVGAEGLLRWHSPELGPISPAEFIPVAESSGLISLVGQWVIEEACRQLSDWKRHARAVVPISINAAAQQLTRAFPKVVSGALQRFDVPGELLEIEVTESSLIGDAGTAAASLKEIRRLGASVAIDDFGTGYSSLAYLSRLPVSSLKIDREFVCSLGRSRQDEAIVQATIAMAHALDLRVVAEGVETEEQLLFLRAYRCDALQGFLFSPPVAPEELATLLAQREPFGELLEPR